MKPPEVDYEVLTSILPLWRVSSPEEVSLKSVPRVSSPRLLSDVLSSSIFVGLSWPSNLMMACQRQISSPLLQVEASQPLPD